MDFQDQQEKRRQSYSNVRALLDYSMGAIYVAAGLFLFFYRQLGMQVDLISRPIAIGLGVVLIVYGGWRIYRGVQKNY
jgi:hypothetical protein